MAIPPLGSSLDCTGITAFVSDQTLRGETASASGSDPVANVATRTFSGAGAGAEADATSLPPHESVTVPGAEESTKPKIYRLLNSEKICKQIYAQFQVTRSLSQAAVLIRSLAETELKLQIPLVAFSKLFRAGRAILLEKEQEKTYFVDVAQKIIDIVGEGRSVKVVSTKLSEILEGSQNAMRAVKAGIQEKKSRKIIFNEVKNILEKQNFPVPPKMAFIHLIKSVNIVLRGSIDEINKNLTNKNFRTFYPLAQKIAHIDTSSASNRPREASHVLPAPGAGAGTVLPSCPILPVSLTAGEITGLLERREDSRLDAAGAGAGVQSISMTLNAPFTATGTVRNAQPNRTFIGAGAEAGTTTGAPKRTRAPKRTGPLDCLLESDEICEKIYGLFKVSREYKGVILIQSLATKELGVQIHKHACKSLLSAGRALANRITVKNSYYVGVAQKIIDQVGKGRPFELVNTTLRGILESSPNAMRAVKEGVVEGQTKHIILDRVTAILKAEDLPQISEMYFLELVGILKFELADPKVAKQKTLKKITYKHLYPLAQKIAQIDRSSAPKRAREAGPVLAGAGGQNSPSDVAEGDAPLTPFCEMEDFDSRGTQEQRPSKRARKTSADLPGIPDLPGAGAGTVSQACRALSVSLTEDERKEVSQSAEDSRRHTARSPSGLFDGGGDWLGALTRIEGPYASGAGAGTENSPSDLPPSELQLVPDETRTGDLQSGEDSRRHTAGGPSGLFDGGGDWLGALTSMGGPCASGAGAAGENSPSDVFLHDDPYAELFGADDGANGGDFVGLLGDNDFADSFSIEDSSPSAGQEEN